MSKPIESIAVIGADLHAWAIALGLTAALGGKDISIQVIGKPVAMRPDALSLDISAHAFHQQLGLQEASLVAEFGGSYRYGTKLSGLNHRGQANDESFYSYSPTGGMLNRVDFHHYITRLKSLGAEASLEQYSLTAQAALQGRFSHPTAERGLDKIDYNIQVDKLRYFAFIKKSAIDNGVQYLEHDVVAAKQNEDSAIVELSLSSNHSVPVDFVFDSNGVIFDFFERKDYQDCSAHLPFNRNLSWAFQSDDATPVFDSLERVGVAYLQTRPLPGGLGCSLVYDDDRLDDARALEIAHQKTAELNQQTLEYRAIKCGYRASAWVANVVSIGDVAGCSGDVLFSSLYHTHTALQRWLDLYPTAELNLVLAEQYNRMTALEFQRVIDVHNLLFSAGDKTLAQADALEHRIRLFSETGNVAFYEQDVLEKQQWVNLFWACGITPKRSDALLLELNLHQIEALIAPTDKMNQDLIVKMPSLDALLNAIRKAA